MTTNQKPTTRAPMDERVIRWATAGRRQPTLIGRDPAGRKLPGGPYTIYQAVSVVVVAIVGWNTRSLWGAGMSDPASLIWLAAALAGTFVLTGRINFAGRNPLWALGGVIRSYRFALGRGVDGTFRGTQRMRKEPYYVRCRAVTTVRPAASAAVSKIADPLDEQASNTRIRPLRTATLSPAQPLRPRSAADPIAVDPRGSATADPVRAAMAKLTLAERN